MKDLDLRHHIAHIAEDHVTNALEFAGYKVESKGYNDHADLIIDGVLRVEVKGSLWVRATNRKGRYQFNTRNHCDIYVLYCIGPVSRCFIIPAREVGTRRNVAIWSQDPRDYQGRWARYLNAWHLIRRELERCEHTSLTSQSRG